MQLALIQINVVGQANHLSGRVVAFAGHVGCEKAVQCFAFVVDVILRLHRFSRVVHREPSVPSAPFKGPTLYEDRDAVCHSQNAITCSACPLQGEARKPRG